MARRAAFGRLNCATSPSAAALYFACCQCRPSGHAMRVPGVRAPGPASKLNRLSGSAGAPAAAIEDTRLDLGVPRLKGEHPQEGVLGLGEAAQVEEGDAHVPQRWGIARREAQGSARRIQSVA